MRKIILWLLTLVPVSSIAVLAQAKINNIENKNRADVLDNMSVREARRLLWSPGYSQLTLGDLQNNYYERSGIENREEFEETFDKHLQNLIDSGQLKIKGQIVSMAPSQF